MKIFDIAISDSEKMADQRTIRKNYLWVGPAPTTHLVTITSKEESS